MPNVRLKRPAKIKMLRTKTGLLKLIKDNINPKKVYNLLIYYDRIAYSGLFNNGTIVLPSGIVYNENLTEEIRVFTGNDELRMIRNEEKIYLGRYVEDGDVLSLSEFIHKHDDNNYLYDEYFSLVGEGDVRSMSDESSRQQRLHKGMRGGNIFVIDKKIRWIGVRNYIESPDESEGLKFNDCRMSGYFDKDFQRLDLSNHL